MRQGQDRDETVLLLATRWQVKSTHKRKIPEQDIEKTGKKASKLETQ